MCKIVDEGRFGGIAVLIIKVRVDEDGEPVLVRQEEREQKVTTVERPVSWSILP